MFPAPASDGESAENLVPTMTTNPSIRGGFVVIVVAAGSGSRLGYGVPKAQVMLKGRSILEHSLRAVISSGVLRDHGGHEAPLVVTVPAGDTALTDIAHQHGAHAVQGGSTRAASVRQALQAAENLVAQHPVPPRGVLVHDAARCLTPPHVFRRVAQAVDQGYPAVIPVMPVVDTIRSVDDQGTSQGAVDRSRLRAVQTPQGFEWDVLLSVNKAADEVDDRITDDASLVEQFSTAVVHTVAGDEAALKVTRPLDLLLAEAIVDAVENAQVTTPRGKI